MYLHVHTYTCTLCNCIYRVQVYTECTLCICIACMCVYHMYTSKTIRVHVCRLLLIRHMCTCTKGEFPSSLSIICQLYMYNVYCTTCVHVQCIELELCGVVGYASLCMYTYVHMCTTMCIVHAFMLRVSSFALSLFVQAM